jgi:peroxiredoxin
MEDSTSNLSTQPGKGFLHYVLIGGLLLGIVMALVTSELSGDRSANRSLSLPQLAPIAAIGSEAPNFSTVSPDGTTITLAELSGKPIALNFWATWCAPCRAEIPELESAYQRYNNDELTIIGVNAGESANVVAAYVLDIGITFDVVLDPSGEVVEAYGVIAFPTTIWIDRTGIIRAKHIGPLSSEDIDRYVKDLLESAG